MNFTQLLSLHRENLTEDCLTNVLCDGFAMKNSPLYRRVRHEVKACGFSFQQIKPESAHPQFYFPLLFINEEYKNKVIYYHDNLSPLINAIELVPKMLLLDPEQGLHKNIRQCIFHDSVHCYLFAKYFDGVIPNFSDHPEAKALAIDLLASEAAASTLERIVSLELFTANEQNADSVVLFFHRNPEVLEAMTRVKKHLGQNKLLRWFFYSYLLANLCVDKQNLEAGDFDKIKNLSLGGESVGPCEKDLTLLANKAIDLNPRFRKNTNRVYFYLCNSETPFDELVSSNSFEEINNHPGPKHMLELIDKLALT